MNERNVFLEKLNSAIRYPLSECDISQANENGKKKCKIIKIALKTKQKKKIRKSKDKEKNFSVLLYMQKKNGNRR